MSLVYNDLSQCGSILKLSQQYTATSWGGTCHLHTCMSQCLGRWTPSTLFWLYCQVHEMCQQIMAGQQQGAFKAIRNPYLSDYWRTAHHDKVSIKWKTWWANFPHWLKDKTAKHKVIREFGTFGTKAFLELDHEFECLQEKKDANAQLTGLRTGTSSIYGNVYEFTSRHQTSCMDVVWSVRYRIKLTCMLDRTIQSFVKVKLCSACTSRRLPSQP